MHCFHTLIKKYSPILLRMNGETKKFSWGPVEAVSSVSLTEVMSEELAEHLNNLELGVVSSDNPESLNIEPVPTELSTDADDFLIAQMLQKQYDREFDSALKQVKEVGVGGGGIALTYARTYVS